MTIYCPKCHKQINNYSETPSGTKIFKCPCGGVVSFNNNKIPESPSYDFTTEGTEA